MRTRCYDSRRVDGYRWRRYECRSCGKRYTTIEVEVDTEKPAPGRGLKGIVKRMEKSDMI